MWQVPERTRSQRNDREESEDFTGLRIASNCYDSFVDAFESFVVIHDEYDDPSYIS